MPMKTTSRAKGGLRKAALPLCLVVFIGGCVTGDPSAPRKGSMCRTAESDGFWGGASEAAVDEGNGHVSVVTSWFTDTAEGGWAINVTDCASGKGASLRTEYGRLDYLEEAYGKGAFTPKDSRFRGTGQEDVPLLRKEGYLADPKRLYDIGRAAGYLPAMTDATPDSKYTICACELYYPKATGDWVKTQKADAKATD